jgi:hypothetical protein
VRQFEVAALHESDDGSAGYVTASVCLSHAAEGLVASEQKMGEPYLWLLTEEERPTGGVAFQEEVERNGQIVVADDSAPSVHLNH